MTATAAAPVDAAPVGPAIDERRFRLGVALIAAAALVIRCSYVLLVRRDVGVGLGLNDAAYYHEAANLLADGRGFIEPFLNRRGISSQAADHPPLYIAFLAAFSFVGLDTPLAHQLVTCLVGTGTVVLVALAARRIAGEGAGLVAGVVAAVYANLWAYDGFLVSESMAQFWVAATLYLAYRFVDAPAVRSVALVGAAIGAATLSRAELCLLVPLLVWPAVARLRGVERSDKWRLALAGTAASLAVVLPWVGYNLSRFDEPVLLSNGFEVTLLSASCDVTYYGPYTGYWSKTCVEDVLAGSGLTDESERSQLAELYREAAFDYIGDNADHLPAVVAARLGRVTGLYQPSQQLGLDVFPEGRERPTARMALAGYYACVALGVAGALHLRRLGRPVLPLLAAPVIVLLTVTITFATTRYRATAEPALATLAGIGAYALLVSLLASLRRRTPAADD